MTSLMLGKYRSNNRALETISFQLMQTMNEVENKNLNAKMESLLTENNQYLNQLKQANLSQENKEVLQQILDKYSIYSQHIKQVLALGMLNKNDKAFQYYKDKVEGPKNEIVQLGDKLEKNSKENAKKINDANQNRANQVFLLVIIGTLIAIILGLLISIIISRMITYPLQLVKDAITKAEEGDFTSYIAYDSKDELGDMAKVFNELLYTLRNTIGQIAEASHQLAAYSIELSTSAEQTGIASEHIATSVQEIANGAEAQVRSLEESGSTLKGMAQNTQHIAENAKTVSEQAIQAEEKSMRGIEAIDKVSVQMNMINESIQELSEVIRKLGARSGEIGLIVDTITGIASQTNLLA
ncbi:methyl-accepting chemotaxis protein, partial [Neobacillus drentensis]